jgi:CubicO group peptidase (beta-lactamase class C family)
MSRGRRLVPAAAVALVYWLLLTAVPARAAPEDVRPAQALTAEDLEVFLNRVVPEQLSKRQIAGAVVVVVADGAVLLSRGYGFADIANKIPMSPDSTLVRPGSVSKLITALAVMQLVEQGRLDLDRDVNDYLDFRIPTPKDGVPVTLRLLLSHRAGFENHLKDLFRAGAEPEPLGVWIRHSLPPRIFPKGDVPAYSNYGYALAGYVVERVSGQRFEDYVGSRILKPLAMDKSTFVQPVPEAMASMVARGYLQSTAAPLGYFEVMSPSPAGGMSTSGADMGRFMLALLGADGADQVVQPETVRQMMTPRVATESVADQPLLGFEEEYAAGNIDIGKHGLTVGFVSELALLPAHKFGLFVSYNSASAGGAPTALIRAVADRYFREPVADVKPLTAGAAAAADTAYLAGAYQSSQREDSNFLRLTALLQQLIVTSAPEGEITVFGEILHETSALHFDGPDDVHVQFGRSENGKETILRSSVVPLALEWRRVPWYLDSRKVLPMVGAAIVVSVATLLLWPVAALWRRRRVPFGNSQRDRRDHLWVRAVLVLDVLTLMGVLLLAGAASDITRFNAKLDPALVALYLCAWLGSLGAAMVIWVAFRFWRDRVGSIWARAHHILIAASAAVLAWFFVTWRIAGVTLNY